MLQNTLLEINDLHIYLGKTPLVRGVSLSMAAGESLGLVGESGCGKSLTALAVMGLLASPPLRIGAGTIRLNGQDLVSMPEASLQQVRGRDAAMIFQEPMTSLNPVFRVGHQVSEVLDIHENPGRRASRTRTAELLEKVGLAPDRIARRYPHELSGGQRQRVMIAMALAGNPKLLIADEPTTALDVTVQAQILDLIATLCREQGMGILLIAHDLGIVRQQCDRVAVMYSGQIVEHGAIEAVFRQPRHPYTGALLATIPARNLNRRGGQLPSIEGGVPNAAERPPGCAFAPRCTKSASRCQSDNPPLEPAAHDSREVRCWYPEPA